MPNNVSGPIYDDSTVTTSGDILHFIVRLLLLFVFINAENNFVS